MIYHMNKLYKVQQLEGGRYMVLCIYALQVNNHPTGKKTVLYHFFVNLFIHLLLFGDINIKVWKNNFLYSSRDFMLTKLAMNLCLKGMITTCSVHEKANIYLA